MLPCNRDRRLHNAKDIDEIIDKNLTDRNEKISKFDKN